MQIECSQDLQQTKIMKNKTKKILAWILIGIPALYFFLLGIYAKSWIIFILSLVWVGGDVLLSRTKK